MKEDVLAATQPRHYFRGFKSHMVGIIALNPVLDRLVPTPLPDYRKRTVLIAFRGSLHPVNFFYDLQFAQLDFSYPGTL
jgi:hypothetical protein